MKSSSVGFVKYFDNLIFSTIVKQILSLIQFLHEFNRIIQLLLKFLKVRALNLFLYMKELQFEKNYEIFVYVHVI